MSTEIASAIVAKAVEAPSEAEAKSAESLENGSVQSTEAEKSTNVDSDMTKRLAMIAKREKAILDQKTAWETEKSELMKRLQALEEESGSYKSKVEAIKNKEWDKVNDLIDVEDLTKYELNGKTPTPESILEKKIAELESKLEMKLKEKDEEYSKKESEKIEKAREQAITQFKGKIKEELDSDFGQEEPKYQWLSIQDSPEEIVYGIIEEYYNKTEAQGKAIALTVEQASEMAEKYLEEEAESKFGKVKKAKTLVEKLFPTEAKQGAPKANAQASSPKTLTNTVSIPTESSGDKKEMTWYDLQKSREDAAKLLRFV